MLGLIGLVASSITKYGFENLLLATTMRLIEKGHTREDVIKSVNKMLISKELKRRIIEIVEKAFRSTTKGDSDAESETA